MIMSRLPITIILILMILTILQLPAGLKEGLILTVEVSDTPDEYQLESTSAFTDTNWHHFAIVWDESSASGSEIYIDGSANSATDSGTISGVGTLVNAVTLRLGSESDGANYFDGQLDEVMIYRYALN